MTYIRIDYDAAYPTVSTTRRPLDDNAKYFGPYLSTASVRQALKILRKIFPYATRQMNGQKRANLHYHLGLDPGLEEGKTSLNDYRANLRKLMAVIEGKRGVVVKELERDMKRAAKAHDFESAAKLRNQVFSLQNLNKQIIFSDKEFMDISKDHALGELVDLLKLEKFPRRIEGYDVSHMQGTDVVASMVVFTNGVSNKGEYRKFKTKKDQNNDFYNMHETICRRLSDKNRKAWGSADIFLIDGGKGQLDAAIKARDSAGCGNLVFIGLAKREEQIVIAKNRSNVTFDPGILQNLGGFSQETDDFILINISHSTNMIKLLQRIRDESHRFAVSYHSTLKRNRQTASALDDIAGIGPISKKQLLRKFGSVKGVTEASEPELSLILGSKKARIVAAHLKKL